jgi:riboflavin synthase
MEKWVLIIGLGNLVHVIDVFDIENECADMRNQMIVEWDRTARVERNVIAYCSPYSEFLLTYNKRNTYTLR